MMKSSIISSSKPRCVVVGDINSDNQMDIVVVNSGTNSFGIFLSKGGGNFANQQTYTTGSDSQPYSIVVNHFNNDNYLDIAVANYGTNSIGIFLGYGNGSFTDQKLISLASSHPLFLTVADFNKDNHLDIVVANYGTNSVGILFGYGNGSFQDQVIYGTGYGSIPYSLAVGDFNSDNQLDIAVANYGTSNIGIFLGYKNGTFANQKTYTTGPNSKPTSIALGHFNNDNQLDIVVSNNGTGNIGIFLGHHNGTFLSQTTYSIGINSYPQSITVDDLNQDNESDIVILDSTNDQIHFLLGYGNETFSNITTYDTVYGANPFSIAVANFNNNSQSDFAIVNYGTNDVIVLIDYSSKPSARETKYGVQPKSVSKSVAVSDFNNDQIRDMIFNRGTFIVLLTGLSNGTFGKEASFFTGNDSNIQYISPGDLNNDSHMDIVISDIGYNNVGVFIGHGNGTFATIETYSTGNDSSPLWVALSDLNNDSHLDIVSANQGTSNIGILIGNGDGTFAPMIPYSTFDGSLPSSVAVDDMNNDHYLDIVVAISNGYIFIFLGDGNGNFALFNYLTTGQDSNTFAIALANFNSDYNVDIVVTNLDSDTIGVFLGYGDGTFTAQTTYSTGPGSNPYYVIVDDFNNDNISDIAVSNDGSDEIVIFYGYGNGEFKLARTYSLESGSKPYGITAADFNNNTKLEIVVSLWGIGGVAVLTEYYAAEFANQTTYLTGSAPQPFSVAVGDFNRDNRSDIVVANSGTDNVGVLLNLGNGTFGIEMIYPIGTDFHPQYVITCDINKDNQLDIVTANSKMNCISVIMGYGNGTFAEQMIYSTGDGSHPFAIASGDFNSDNWLDLVIANEGTDDISIFLGFDYASFQNQQIYSSINNSEPYGIVVSDFNNDKFLDIAVAFYASNTLGILLGYGNGSFATMMIYSTNNGSQPTDVAVGDVNNDSQLDIIVTNYGTNNIGVLLGYGNGSFAPIMSSSTEQGSNPRALIVADLNNDTQLDIVVVNYGTNSIAVLLGYGNGTFSIIGIYLTGNKSSPHALAVGDFNHDDQLDIVVANYGTDSVGVLLGYGNGTFGNQKLFSSGDHSNPCWVSVGDFNRDNQLDIATANWNNNNVGILLGYGNGTFAHIKTYSTGTGSAPNSIGVDDFNNDSILDIAVANDGTGDIVVLFGFGDGSFLLGTSYSTGSGSQPWALGFGDFNNDSRLDMTVANFRSNNIGIFLGSGNQPLGGMTTYDTGDRSQPHSVAIGDFNNDGRLDIAVANYGTDNIGILLGHGSGIFDNMRTCRIGTGSAPYSVAVDDFNNDHHLDIVVADSGTDTITILFGYGNGTFAIGRIYSTGAQSCPYTVTIGDFNNDNISDIAVANSGTSNIFLLYGYGNGTFGNETSYSLGYNYQPYAVAVHDLTQDNWMDIVIACYGTDHVETLIKMC